MKEINEERDEGRSGAKESIRRRGKKRVSMIPVLRLFVLGEYAVPCTINSSTAALSTRSNSMSKLEAQPECARKVNTRAHVDGDSLVMFEHWFRNLSLTTRGDIRDSGQISNISNISGSKRHGIF